MVEMHTPKGDIGFKAPDFSLKGTDEKIYSLEDVKGENGLVVTFICNHCPFVRAIMDDIIAVAKELQEYGIGFIAVMANDAHNFPQDSFPNMKRLVEKKNLPFPYVMDETQEMAQSYGAVCTPDFFGFNKDLELKYRGRLSASTTIPVPNSRRELFDAMVKISKTGEGPEAQYSSIGCSIKWK